jgi:hypothetical protein
MPVRSQARRAALITLWSMLGALPSSVGRAEITMPPQSVIEHYFPKSVRFSAGENCEAPAARGKTTGVAIYYATAHPKNANVAMVTIALLYKQDCGLAGHSGANGADPHAGDVERIRYTLKPDTSCSVGWRLHALKTLAHSSDYKRREVNEKIYDSCNPPNEIVSSLGKHATYLSWSDCSKRTPAEVCLDDFGAGFTLYNLDDKPSLSTLMGGGSDYLFKADGGDDHFCGGQSPKDRSSCVSGTPGDKLKTEGDIWELPDPDLGGSHKCPYGLDESGGLCYQMCKSGYTGAATMCVPSCPSDFRDDGLYCAKPDSYGRGAGYPWKGSDGVSDKGMYRRCEKDHGKGNCQKDGAIVYPKCKANFHKVGCCVCSPDCPSGMTDIGVSCQKKTYDRGVGCLP